MNLYAVKYTEADIPFVYHIKATDRLTAIHEVLAMFPAAIYRGCEKLISNVD